MISKQAGGIGLSVHNIRAAGSYIRGTNGTSNGLVPMLRVFNNTARYVDQGQFANKPSSAARTTGAMDRSIAVVVFVVVCSSVPLLPFHICFCLLQVAVSAKERSPSTWSRGMRTSFRSWT
jgi:hypothetical protein